MALSLLPATDFCRILRFVDNVLSGLLTFARVKPPATIPLIIKTRRGLGPLAVDGGRSGEKLDWICKEGTRWEWFRNHIQSHRKRAFFELERSLQKASFDGYGTYECSKTLECGAGGCNHRFGKLSYICAIFEISCNCVSSQLECA